MFDVRATNAVTITNFSTQVDANGDFQIWTRPGTHVGFGGSAAGWTLLGTGSATAGVNQPIGLTVSVPVAAGATQAFAIFSSNTDLRYSNGTAIGAVAAADANISILEGWGNTNGFGGVMFAPRVFIGSVTYTPAVAVATIPTLSEWAMIAFGLLLAGAAVAHLQRRRGAV